MDKGTTISLCKDKGRDDGQGDPCLSHGEPPKSILLVPSS